MKKILSNKPVIALFVLPGLLVFCLIFIYPMFYTLNLSLTSWKGIGPKEYIGLQNYSRLLQDEVFVQSVKNTFLILAVAMVGQLVPALVFALLLSGLKRGTRVFRIAYFIPVLLSSTAIALMWERIYSSSYGMLNEILTLVGLESWTHDWLSDEATCRVAVVVPVIWQWIGYHMIILYAGLKAIPDQYVEAAKLDGANAVQLVTRIILPMLRDILKVCIVLAAVGSIKIFDNIYIMTSGGPYNMTSTIAIDMYKEAFLKLNFGYGSAIAVVLCVICMLVYLVINRLMAGDAIEY
ncbi:MAG: sugar ABC transporter permease [Eubacteriales bacterium]|nr:sugar ABC transporter permease [Eubacteriales bacterium]